MQPPINQLYKFGQFCLDVSERVLRRDGGVGQCEAGTDGVVLRQIEAGAGTRRSVEAGATGDAQGRESAASLLLGEFHPIRRVGELGGQAMT
jgi:hypothetical protein